ncbi:MAG: CPBP family intramembrane metalloprotease [Fidelibacterota bacterium]|nr:MAG: CPBP family intramembrane metalloprotease [Candidatus Neomarinimicrobiota bacterium]
MSSSWRDYPRLSRTAWYSLIFILPLVAIYEILAVLINWESVTQLRNGADVLLRQLLYVFGLTTPHIMGIFFIAGVIATWMWQRQKHGTTQVAGIFLTGMMAESLLWAGILLVFLAAADQLMMIVTVSDTVLKKAFLAVGAGIYEEGVFRLILITGLATFFQHILDWQRQIAWGMAIGIAAVLFSLFHYIGPAGETFSWNSFGYRSVAGGILGLLFIYRGFGITAYAHTIYNLLALGLQTVR